MKKIFSVICIAALMMTGCGQEVKTETQVKEQAQEGNLTFVASGEEAATEGFTTKDGWDLEFDHIYLTVSDIKAYQLDTDYDAETQEAIKGEASAVLEGEKTVDLAQENPEIGQVKAPYGQYNAMSWKVIKATEGVNKGAALTFIGKAKKDGKEVNFEIALDKENMYYAGEYLGDERKGILDEGDADLQMTYHLDHLFGSIKRPDEEGVLGFEPLVKLEKDNMIKVDMKALQEGLTKEEFKTLVDSIPHVGHVGEGHAYTEEI
ncbi:DUF4382 domain-containing protein [Anaerophilus nitritogenes]|uniref:DUF4382 domain-containing protein n=1 Tax=Anaerophilus nitritogenes TaxID=2498136 RepID=UPI00101D7418|nr:DUF4382 domain-containing protein [Anaerophilus nitritogenes]